MSKVVPFIPQWKRDQNNYDHRYSWVVTQHRDYMFIERRVYYRRRKQGDIQFDTIQVIHLGKDRHFTFVQRGNDPMPEFSMAWLIGEFDNVNKARYSAFYATETIADLQALAKRQNIVIATWAIAFNKEVVITPERLLWSDVRHE
ncbi:hypothetical protein AVT69_gp332 [Pseudomonas phage PhiPA3]|uniref:Uncharacterized protein 334 n=1 Tax=Pseudomonas phage PhiPA3 TaxID=998086 RepID=F8SJH0_BPPA3|nr:hypothetical protein AVT69_gp332 [Pseudomonas phage PhiPA3]AEH03757.1 hypothetical protein [Pseudomonas phage PhiPA3]